MSIRTERVARLLQRDIAEILNRDFDPSLLVTVTRARMSGDLSIAYIHLSVLGHTLEQRQATFQYLKDQTPRIRASIARRLRHQLRAMPELRFFLDESHEELKRMDQLLARVRTELPDGE